MNYKKWSIALFYWFFITVGPKGHIEFFKFNEVNDCQNIRHPVAMTSVGILRVSPCIEAPNGMVNG